MEHGVDFAPPGAGRQNDTLDESAQSICRFLTLFRVRKGLGKPLDLATVNLRDVRMNIRDIGGCRSEPGADGVFLCFKLEQLIDKRARSLAFRRECDQTLDRLEDLLQFLPIRALGGTARMVEAIALLDIGANGFRGDFRAHQPVAQPFEYPRLQLVARDTMPVGTASRVDMVRTGKPPLPAKGIRPAAAAAVDETGQQAPGAMGAVHGIMGRARRFNDAGILDRDIVLSRLGGLPEFIIQDP